MRFYLQLARSWRALRARRPDVSVLLVGLLRHMRSGRFGTAKQYPEQILVVRLDAMGDLVMTTPIFRELKLHFPNAMVTAVVQESNKAILEYNPYVDRIICPPAVNKSRLFNGLRRRLSILVLYWTQVRKECFSTALHPRFDADYYGAAFFLTLVNATLTVKYVDRSPSSLINRIADSAMHAVVNLPRPIAQHEVLSNSALVESLSGVPCTSVPEIFLTEEDRTYARCILAEVRKNATVVCIAPGAQAFKRRWPIDRWATVATLLAEDRDISVLVICSQEDKHDGLRLLKSLSKVPTRLVSSATVRQVAACIELCDLFLGTDSGLAHLAAAVYCPSLIVSPHPKNGDPKHGNSPIRFRPWSNNSHVIQPGISRAPCSTGCDAIEPHCILQVTPEQVATMGKPLLYFPEQHQASWHSE